MGMMTERHLRAVPDPPKREPLTYCAPGIAGYCARCEHDHDDSGDCPYTSRARRGIARARTMLPRDLGSADETVSAPSTQTPEGGTVAP